MQWYRRVRCDLCRGAQKDLFGHTTVGDLRPYLSGFFDTNSGPKVRTNSAALKLRIRF